MIMKTITATTTRATNETVSPYRFPAWAAIASGIIGIIAVGFLIAYLVIRSDNMDEAMRMGNIHDVGVMVQFLLLIPVFYGLQKLSQLQPPGISKATIVTGIVAICFTALFLLLGLVKAMADVVYMFPQGVFGVWLMVVCWRTKKVLPNSLRWFGMIVGFGLALVGSFPLQYAIFVDKIILQMPAASDEAVAKIPISHANMILHQVLWLGSPLGVLTLPFWTLLLGRKLFRAAKFEA